ncbi:MAG: hypothetical protein DWQ18_03585 [Crenarchaeota archaeon]|nr:MAG: hypothetical protein DWQ17_09545 [Thermoproteota archaeon]RDJ33996.1 MAG: hypothetical protein DWQ18_03585 [Thermoproteota archaeon]RDJ36889.1 MAG: hypothetical protein DWQ13_07030 [Thermoproteota archaeon]RDJ37575.1 MAG: hypothetical protein DWQ19_03805 [Thermoproteota archaeon]
MHKEALKLVYSGTTYWIISGIIFVCLLLFLLSAREFLFFEPFWAFHIPSDWIPQFVLILVVAGLISLVSSLAVYQIRMLKANSKKTGTGVIGSLIGIGAGVCTSCGPIGFSIITTFGVAAASTLSFLYEYEIPIRLVAIAILIATYFMMIRGISKECKVRIDEK